MQELLGNGLNLRARDDRNDELLLHERAFQLLEHNVQTLRLHGEHDDRAVVRPFRLSFSDSLAITLEHLDAILHVHLFTPRLPRVTTDNLLGTNQLLTE